ncbi:hypothetical protein [Streptomyces luteolus]|uniref:Uncharacterized protein n=1 Tax=Streptomyces luteolus TaxID=3043615 RepID=A0ABT6SX77_9ACTN|nr:hypothetical protein [Streptomyces sp. B-S-A12]MDI3419815.1 hypothetical protein [Streptomyces sp. B-S-A12]
MRHQLNDVVMDVERCLVGQVKGYESEGGEVMLERPSGARWFQLAVRVRTASPAEAATLSVRTSLQTVSKRGAAESLRGKTAR